MTKNINIESTDTSGGVGVSRDHWCDDCVHAFAAAETHNSTAPILKHLREQRDTRASIDPVSSTSGRAHDVMRERARIVALLRYGRTDGGEVMQSAKHAADVIERGDRGPEGKS